MKHKIRNILLLTALLTLLLGAPALADTVGGGVVTADALHLRSEAHVDAPSLTLIPRQAFLLVEEETEDWYKVCWQGWQGYVSARYVDFAARMEGSAAAAVQGSHVRMRGEPNTKSAILGIYNTGDTMTVLGVDGRWLKVSDSKGTCGYIRSDLLDYVHTAAGTTAAASGGTENVGEQLVATAKTYLGTDYVWGGMSESGFDCSGFVNYVYRLYGYSMYRVAQDIYTNNGSAVSKDQLQPGDLVFFGYSAWNITHVGMYIGNDQFIHASSSADEVVITDLSENYYTRMYVGARRLIT